MATTEKGIYYPDDYTKPADVPEDMKKLAESVDTVVSNLDTNKVDKVDGKGLSTNDYTNEDKAKLDSLENYDDTEIKQDIEDIQAKDEAQDTEIDKQSDLIQKLKDNCINVTTEESTSLQVTDASTVPAKLDVRGGERQDGIPTPDTPVEVEAVGDNVNIFPDDLYNYFSSNQNAIKELNGKEFKITTTANRYSGIYLNSNNDFYKDLTNKIKEKIITYSFDVKADSDIQLLFGTTGYETIRNVNNNWQRLQVTYEKKEPGIYFYNSSATVTTFYIRNIKLIFGEGDNLYSPYGQGSVEVKKINKNWVKIDTPRTVERGGLSITLDDEGVFTINGTSTANIYINLINIGEYQNTTLTNYKLPLKKYKAYFDLIQKNNSAVSESNGDASFNIRNFAASSTGEQATTYCVFGGLIKGNTGVQIKDCNITDGRVVAYLYVANGVKLDNFKFRFALYNEDETDTDFEEHKEQSYILDIQKPMLLGDYFVKEADGWKEVHGWNKEFFANIINNAIISSSNMHMTIPNFSNNKALLPSNSEIANIFSNVFKPIAFANIDKVDYGIGIYYASDSLVIRIKDCVILEDYKNALNNEDFYFYYKLATSTKLPCTKVQSNILDQLNELELFKGTNNIITAEGLALMQMQYIVDTQSYIDNRIDEKLTNINQQILNIVGGN